MGFVMPSVVGYSELHLLNSPQSRKQHFPSQGWHFLIHVATNIARAFEIVHARGQVVGDVNDRNILVGQDGTVKFVDCDSFQIRSGTRIFPCGLGVPTHTPPELQGKALRNELRTTNHDCFGMAVVIFQLLFMGRHPFAGRYSGHGEMPLELAIRQTRFAYGANAPSLQMARPPGTLALSSLSSSVAEFFERAFSTESAIQRSRPTPSEWKVGLSELAASLRVCSTNGNHQYFKGEQHCPWCYLEQSTKVTYFSFSGISLSVKPLTASITEIWHRIESLAPPPTSSLRISLPVKPVPPTTEALSMASKYNRAGVLSGAFVLLIWSLIILFLANSEYRTMLLAGSIVLGSCAYLIGTKGPKSYKGILLERKQQLEEQIESLDKQFQNASPENYLSIERRLLSLKNEFDSLPRTREAKLERLRTSARERQFFSYLSRYRIDSASITGIGASRSVVLASYGVETANDVSWNRVRAIPGFGDSLTSSLVSWRKSHASRFAFDPSKAISQSDINLVNQEISVRAAEIVNKLTSGYGELVFERDRAISAQAAARSAAIPILESLAQVEANLGAF